MRNSYITKVPLVTKRAIVGKATTDVPSASLKIQGTPSLIELTLDTSPFFFMPLNESEGTDAIDFSGNGYDSTYNNVNVGNSTFVDGTPASTWTNNDSAVNLYPTGYYENLSEDTGTIAAWSRDNSGAWPTTYGAIWEMHFTAGSALIVRRNSTGSRLQFIRFGRTYDWTHHHYADWFHWAMTWDVNANETIVYLDGVAVQTSTLNGSITLPPTTVNQQIGRYSNSYNWPGNIRNFGWWDRVLTEEEILSIGTYEE